VRKYDAKTYDLAKEVFGEKIPPHPFDALDLQRRYGFLAPERADAVVRIDGDYSALASKIGQNDALVHGRRGSAKICGCSTRRNALTSQKP